jgi:hypothetical protein
VYGIIHAPSFWLVKVRTKVPMEAVVKLRRSVEKMFSAGVVLAVVLSGTLMAAPSSKATTPAAAPAKAAPAKAAQPAQRPVQPNVNRPAPQNPIRPQQPAGGNARPPIGTPPIVARKPIDRSQPAKYQPHAGEQSKPLAGGRTEIHNPVTNRTVRTNAQGHVTNIEARRPGLAGGSIAINRSARGQRMVVTGRPGARVVSYGPHRGFVERSVVGRPGYISRTYIVGGRSYAHVYRERHYHGLAYYGYVPGVYYGRGFYAWALTPWGAPVAYGWGGGFVAPWFGFYAGYFTPYGTYASPDLWLTDYLIGQNLRLAYESQQAGNADQAPQPSDAAQPNAANLSPEVKALIADEVRQQLAAEKAAALEPSSSVNQEPVSGSEPLPPALKQRFFVVSSNLDITTEANQACSLTPGDIIQRKGLDASADGGVAVEVVSSKPGDCAADSRAAVQLADLQEMHNQFREQLDSGLKTLADNQARGLPNAPAAAPRTVAEGTTDPAPGAEAQLVAQETDAAKLEDQVRQDGSAN